MSWLPNREGYAFLGVRTDGSRVACRVERDGDGTCRVAGAEFAELKGWLPMPMVRGA